MAWLQALCFQGPVSSTRPATNSHFVPGRGGWDQQQPPAIMEQSAPEPGWTASWISPCGRYAKGCDRRASWVTSTRTAICSPQQNNRSSLQRPVTLQEQDEGSAVPDKPVLSV